MRTRRGGAGLVVFQQRLERGALDLVAGFMEYPAPLVEQAQQRISETLYQRTLFLHVRDDSAHLRVVDERTEPGAVFEVGQDRLHHVGRVLDEQTFHQRGQRRRLA